MSVTSETSAPYTTSSSILDIISRYRDRGMQTPVNAEVLGRSGISESLISRTLQALTVLDLIDEDGMPTETFEGIRLSPETEYKQRLQEWLRGVYSDVFRYVDPTEDDDTKIRDAFRTYKPMGQQSRMVSLFIGLCDAAGLRPEKTADRPRAKAQRITPKSTKKEPSRRKSINQKSAKLPPIDGLPAPLEGMLFSLPASETGWTQSDRDKFLQAFNVVLDFCYPIVEEPAEESDNDDYQFDD